MDFHQKLRPNPRYQREDLHRFINELNVRYNIGISIPDRSLSPSKRKAQETSAIRLYTRLEIHFYHGGVPALEDLTAQFDQEAKKLRSLWATNSEADPGALLKPISVPLADNQIQREWLQLLFLQVLDRSPPTRSFSRTRSGPASFSMEKSTLSQSKRAAELDLDKASMKRSRTAGQTASAAQANNPFVLPRTGRPFAAPKLDANAFRPGSSTRQDSRRESFAALTGSAGHSESTSRTSLRSVVFSAEISPSTQDSTATIEASTQEQTRGLSTSQHDFKPTSTMEDYLHKSFEDHEASVHLCLKDTGSQNAPCLPTKITDPSCPTSSALEEALHSFLGNQPLRQGEPTSAETLPVLQSRSRLHLIWPTFPDWLKCAPFSIRWEVLRLATASGVDLSSLSCSYNPEWNDQQSLRGALRTQEPFRGKPFPPASDVKAWEAAIGSAPNQSQHIVFAASLEFGSIKSGSNLRLRLQPLKLDKSHRLGRKYGADRFLELLVPSLQSSNLPPAMKNESFYDEVIDWLTREPHIFCGRRYRPFYVKSGGKKTFKNLQLGPDPRPVHTDRIYLFAEDDMDSANSRLPPVPVESMLSWALDLEGGRNDSQPVLKLFQRIALVLSKTDPTIIFEPSQIRNRAKDLLSPSLAVMNDGVSRMSYGVAKKIQAILGLDSAPCAVQGRLGSAKGMFVLDVTDTTGEVWIETYPSQEKWDLDWEVADEEHRTLEVRSWPQEKIKSATFNLQILPVLEDRAADKRLMREIVGQLLQENLRMELKHQKDALENPLSFQQWVSANSAHRHDRSVRGHVPFQGGLPQEDEEIIRALLNAGFDPLRNEFLNHLIYSLQKRRCDTLGSKLNIRVGRSAYLYMVVDFCGVVEEGEVHIGFSDRFKSELDDWEGTMVHGVDVLVARSPAHFISDIQRVKAVFRPELARLQNVIVFSAKGNTPLADKLSGGDYDGDMCFCVWDDRVVGNFINADAQEPLDLRKYYRQDKIQLRQLLATHNQDFGAAIREMIEKCFAFNLSQQMLGICTNYKERFCYSNGNVCDEKARILSSLLSILVDSAKQGIEFDSKTFKAFKESFGLPEQPKDPQYKKDNWPFKKAPGHILDHLKFSIAQPTIAEELRSFHEALKSKKPEHWDKDLTAKHYDEWDGDAGSRELERKILGCLKTDIKKVLEEWEILSKDDSVGFAEMAQRTYISWQGIQPCKEVPEATLQRLHRGQPQTSEWALLKASTTFKMFFSSRPRFVWQVAGWHLCYIKWLVVSEKQMQLASAGCVGRMPAVLTAEMFAITKTDPRVVKHLVGDQASLGREADADGDEEDV